MGRIARIGPRPSKLLKPLDPGIERHAEWRARAFDERGELDKKCGEPCGRLVHSSGHKRLKSGSVTL